ncbi:unnamed protein product [Rhizophagus irregularis]|uniref:Uncharacterized protein n=1 Tax=Rhizophagus irregularis TaxID=588596 RepID=A0A2N1NSH0_9GLOM|nr:hypothetical protein RhiirC2_772013 [Rhizophagus irregularis]CAB4383984.1 unnamed protein product [Rhizophagus irregularis]CAB5361129.1 unnamed protein product [Rhizophagus irregularis]
MMNNFTDNVSISQAIQTNECKFFHYIPEDNNFYHITCQIILRGSVLDDHDYDHGFCYHGSTINYYVKYYTYSVTQPRQQIDFNNISPKSEMRPSFNRNSNSLYRNIGNNIMATPMNDNQNNANEVGGYIHNAIHPQQQVDFNNVSPAEREMRPVYNNRNTNTSHENIKDNLMTTQATSMIDNQKSCLPYQNEVEDTRADLNNFPQRQIPERETIPDYNRNTNSLQNDVLAYDVSTTDNHRDTRNAYPQQYTSDESITTQDIPITAVDRNYDDINDMPCNDHDININLSVTTD